MPDETDEPTAAEMRAAIDALTKAIHQLTVVADDIAAALDAASKGDSFIAPPRRPVSSDAPTLELGEVPRDAMGHKIRPAIDGPQSNR